MSTRVRGPVLRLAFSAAVLGLAFLVGWATHSSGAFVAIVGVGLVVQLVLRFAVWR